MVFNFTIKYAFLHQARCSDSLRWEKFPSQSVTSAGIADKKMEKEAGDKHLISIYYRTVKREKKCRHFISFN
jgi:hypothetical protein